MSDEHDEAKDASGQPPSVSGVPHDMQPMRFEIAAGYSPTGVLQPGSHYTLAPIPSALEFEEIMRPEGMMVCYTMHTVIGVFRFLFPMDAARYHHTKLGEIVSKPRPLIATAMPPEPPPGANRQQRRHPR